jgi:hypothetical protein
VTAIISLIGGSIINSNDLVIIRAEEGLPPYMEPEWT